MVSLKCMYVNESRSEGGCKVGRVNRIFRRIITLRGLQYEMEGVGLIGKWNPFAASGWSMVHAEDTRQLVCGGNIWPARPTVWLYDTNRNAAVLESVDNPWGSDHRHSERAKERCSTDPVRDSEVTLFVR